MARRLGEREASVMEVLWSRDDALTVRDVLERLSADRDLAYTTVMTVLDNLHRKGFVHREKSGRAYRYRAAVSRSAHTATLMNEALEGTSDRSAALLHFVESISPTELAELRAIVGGLEDDQR